MMSNKIVVVNNFLDYEDSRKLRHYALGMKFGGRDESTQYEGLRTSCLSEFDPLLYESMGKAMLEAYGYSDVESFSGSLTFHVNRVQDKNEMVFKDVAQRIHIDQALHTGILYLTPFPKPNSGLMIYHNNQIDCIQNEYNKMVIFDSNFYRHAIEDFFGEDLFDGRLTMNFFVFEVVDAKKGKFVFNKSDDKVNDVQ